MKQEQIEKILEEHKAWLNRTGGAKADLYGADLCGADLCDADLRDAHLYGANLCDANLRDADLRGADLRGVRYNEQTAYYAMQCPEKGAYIGYKKAEGKIVELEIQADAKRSSATTRKCRASKAKVLSITSIDGKEHFEEAKSSRDQSFVYRVGKTVEVKDFDEDRWRECSTGIHHFITREEAAMY